MDIAQVRRFRRSLRQFERLLAGQIKTCCVEVTFAQCLLMMEIDESETATLGRLATRLRLDNSTLSRTIDGLVAKGMVDRRRGDADRRTVHIRLTAKGRSVARSIHRSSDACVLGLFERIPAGKRDTIVRHFETLVGAFLDLEAESDSAPCDPTCRPNARSTASTR